MRTLRDEFEIMQNDMEAYFLTVVLAPQKRRTNEGGMIRVVVSRNPAWYRKLCEDHPKCRTKPRQRKKSDTAIKRGHVVRALRVLCALARPSDTLETLAARIDSRSVYIDRLLLVADRLRRIPIPSVKKPENWWKAHVEDFDPKHPF